MLNNLRSVISRGGRSVVPRRNFSTYEAYTGCKWGRKEREENIRQEVKQEWASKHFVGADASSPRLSLDSSSLNKLPREEVNDIVLAVVEMENKREELENGNNTAREELNQMKNNMKAKFPRLFK